MASTMPSATPRYVPARMTWLTALTAWPAPIGPTWVMVLPIAASTGRARSTSGVAADEDRERRLLGAFAATRDGRIHHRQAAFAQARGEVPAARRGDRRAVDDERPRSCPADDAVLTEEDRFHVRRVRHADDDDVGSGGGVRGTAGGLDPEFGELRGAIRRPIPDDERETGPSEVGGHGRPHRAQAQEGDALHVAHGTSVPGLRGWSRARAARGTIPS